MQMGVSEAGVVRWSVPRGPESFHTWRSALCHAFMEMGADRSTAAGFWGTIELVDDPTVKLTRVRSADITASRDRRQVAGASSERVYVIHMIEGAGTITQQRREHRLDPGGVVVVDGSVPFVLDFHTPHDVFSYQLDRASLVGHGLSTVTQRRTLAPEDPAVGLLIHQMHTLHAVRTRPDERRVIAAGFRDLVRLALRRPDPLPDAPSVRAARRAQVLDEIATHHRRPDCSVALVAASLGVTPRYVHALLEPTGRSFGQHLREHRLAWAAGSLRAQPDTTVARIAADAGFGDLSTFHRHFRARFGCSPAVYRRLPAD